jgi:hypothetical protein
MVALGARPEHICLVFVLLLRSVVDFRLTLGHGGDCFDAVASNVVAEDRLFLAHAK